MTKKELVKKILLYALFTFALCVLQALVFPRLPIAGAKPLIFPVAAAAVGMFEGSLRGGFFGLAAGILCDMACGSGVLFTLALPFVGLLCGLLAESVLIRSFHSFFLCAAVALLLLAFLQLFPLLAFEGVSPELPLRVALVQTAYSLAFTVPLYYVALALSRRRRT